MISASLCASTCKMRARSWLLPWGTAVALLLTGPLAAQTSSSNAQNTPPSLSACESVPPDTPHSDALRKVCEYAVTIPQRMPNFTCEQKATRYLSGQPADVVTAMVTYEDGKESYRDIKSNGEAATDRKVLDSGTWSTGQFGAHLRSLFDTTNKVNFQFLHQDQIHGRRVLIFQYRIAHQDVPAWRLHVHGQVLAPPYHGQLLINEDSGQLFRLQVVATEIPPAFPLRSADLEIDYQDVSFGDGTSFVLPLQSVVNGSDHDGRNNSNVLEFRNCHKFRATSRIVPQ
jgi:hypothetical protein